MRYSARTGRWHGKAQRPPGHDPYSRTAPGHAERQRQHVTDLGGGLVRIDLGTPPARLACESPAVALRGPEHPPEVAPATPKPPMVPPRLISPREWRDGFGLNRDGL